MTSHERGSPTAGRGFLFRVTRPLLAMLGLAVAAGATAEGAPPGASSCSGCHAAAAVSIPPLAGQPAQKIVADMRAFRTGERPATVMDRIAKGFSDEEAEAIAEWLAGNHR
jgi:cytochrome c553